MENSVCSCQSGRLAAHGLAVVTCMRAGVATMFLLHWDLVLEEEFFGKLLDGCSGVELW